MPKVLLTGGTGFIAGYCIKQLLQKDYQVITTVRTPEKGDAVLKAHAASTKTSGQLTYQIVHDVAQLTAFDEVIKSTPDLDYVLHTASPFHYNVQNPVKDFLEPAVNGVTGILTAIKKYAPTVKRVVFTSSFAAMRRDAEKSPVYDESSWNPITWDEAAQNTKKTYQGSKTLAEKAAWDFMEREKPNFEFVAINPTLVFGPAAPQLQPGDLSGLNTSNLRILDMIQGKMKDGLAPTGFYTWVDVRDVATAHIRGMELPEAAGGRFFLISGYHTNKAIAQIVASISPALRGKLPSDLDAVEEDLPAPEDRYRFNNKKSVDVLGIQYTPLDVCVKDTVESLLKLGA